MVDSYIPVANHVLLPDEIDEIGAQVSCLHAMGDTLATLKDLVRCSHRFKRAEKRALLDEIDHIYHHLRTPVDTMLQDVRAHQN